VERELNDLLGGLMSDPAAMETLGGLLSSLSGAPSSDTAETGGGALLTKLLPLLSGGGDSREVALLRAVRPYLHDGREKRVDEAIELLHIMKLLPLITGKGGLLHGE
jgi:hypothetical protein